MQQPIDGKDRVLTTWFESTKSLEKSHNLLLTPYNGLTPLVRALVDYFPYHKHIITTKTIYLVIMDDRITSLEVKDVI